MELVAEQFPPVCAACSFDFYVRVYTVHGLFIEIPAIVVEARGIVSACAEIFVGSH